MKTTDPVDAARLELMLTELRLPAIKLLWSRFADQADKEGWPAARFLAALSEHEIAERDRRRLELGTHSRRAPRPRGADRCRLPMGKGGSGISCF